MTFGCHEKSALGKVAWETLAADIAMKGQVLLDLLHYDPECRNVGAPGIP